jgi:hypothetical protein
MSLVDSVQGVWVPRVVLLGTGSGAPAILLSQLLYLFRRDPEGSLVLSDTSWAETTGLSPDQVVRARAKLVDKGLLTCGRERVEGSMTTVYRLNLEGLDKLAEQWGSAASTPRLRGMAHREVATPSLLENGSKENIESRKRRRTKVPLPEPFVVTEQMSRWAGENHPTVHVDNETVKFEDYHRSRGSLMLDWPAAWRNWIRMASSFAKGNGSRSTRNNPLAGTEQYIIDKGLV